MVRKFPAFAFSLLLVTVVIGGIAQAAPAGQEGLPDLVPVDISWPSSTFYQGDQVPFTVVCENQGDAPVPSDATVRFQVVLRTAGGTPQEVVAPVEGDLPDAAGLGPGGTAQATVTLTAPTSGNYEVAVVLDPGGEVEEADEENNELAKPFEVTSALPPGVAQLFAGLGMFAAVMAIVAVGTEAVVDFVKVVIGMKQKVTALEALEKLKQELPGQLASLGVDEEALKKVDALFGSLGETLQPVEDLVDVYEQIKAGEFKEAFEALQKMGGPDAGQELDVLKEQAVKGVRRGLAALQGRLGLSDELVRRVEQQVVAFINGITPETAAGALGKVFGRLQELSPQLTEAWLRSQVDVLLARGRTEAMAGLEQNMLPVLRGLGFKEETLTAVRSRVEKALDAADRATRERADTYVLAVRNLLQAVEERRNEMQSPLRKAYRRFRQRGWPATEICVGLVVAVLVVWSGVASWAGRLLAAVGSPSAPPAALWGVSLVAGLAAGALAGWLVSLLDVASSDGVDPEVEKRIGATGPTTLASVLLWREDQHRDEEISRQRILRALTVVVGVCLAYMLNVDAAVLLDYAVPGVAAKINVVNLHEIWSAIPQQLTPGIILTGLAASAGSKFWHDLLGRLQQTKEQAETTAALVRKVQGMVEGKE